MLSCWLLSGSNCGVKEPRKRLARSEEPSDEASAGLASWPTGLVARGVCANRSHGCSAAARVSDKDLLKMGGLPPGPATPLGSV